MFMRPMVLSMCKSVHISLQYVLLLSANCIQKHMEIDGAFELSTHYLSITYAPLNPMQKSKNCACQAVSKASQWMHP